MLRLLRTRGFVVLIILVSLPPCELQTQGLNYCSAIVMDEFHLSNDSLHDYQTVAVLASPSYSDSIQYLSMSKRDSRPSAEKFILKLPDALLSYFPSGVAWREREDTVSFSTQRYITQFWDTLFFSMPPNRCVMRFSDYQPDVVLVLDKFKAQVSNTIEYTVVLDLYYVFWDNKRGQPIKWGRLKTRSSTDVNFGTYVYDALVCWVRKLMELE